MIFTTNIYIFVWFGEFCRCFSRRMDYKLLGVGLDKVCEGRYKVRGTKGYFQIGMGPKRVGVNPKWWGECSESFFEGKWKLSVFVRIYMAVWIWRTQSLQWDPLLGPWGLFWFWLWKAFLVAVLFSWYWSLVCLLCYVAVVLSRLVAMRPFIGCGGCLGLDGAICIERSAGLDCCPLFCPLCWLGLVWILLKFEVSLSQEFVWLPASPFICLLGGW